MESRRYVLSISSFLRAKRIRGIKGSQSRKCYRRESNSGPHGGIICMSETQLPHGCSALLIFMSQTDQRQLSLSVCLSLTLSNNGVYAHILCMCNLHSSGTSGRQKHENWYTTGISGQPESITYSCRDTYIQCWHHYPAGNIKLKNKKKGRLWIHKSFVGATLE